MPTPVEQIKALRESCLETVPDPHETGVNIQIWTEAWECYDDAFDNAEGLVARLVEALTEPCRYHHIPLTHGWKHIIDEARPGAVLGRRRVIKCRLTKKARAALGEA